MKLRFELRDELEMLIPVMELQFELRDMMLEIQVGVYDEKYNNWTIL